MRTLFLAAFLLSTILVQGQVEYTPETIPNTKLVNNSYVSNPDNILFHSTVSRIDSLLGDLERRTTAQVAVVVVESVGDRVIEVFAQELFQLWGIGRSNNNGLLILLVKGKRQVRFHTGYGLEGPLPDATCNQIQRSWMVPAFKNNDYDLGMYDGVNQVYKILTDPTYTVEIRAADDDGIMAYSDFVIFMAIFFLPVFLIVWAVKKSSFRDSKNPTPTDYKQMRFKRNPWLIEFGGVPLLIILVFWILPQQEAAWYAIVTIYFYYMATVLHRVWRERRMIKNFLAQKKYFDVTEYLRKSTWYWLLIALIFPVPFLFYFPFHFSRKKFYRNHSRTCSLCDKDMIKLSEIEDDEHLSKGQQVEEQIRSVDYDVWKCTGCGATERWAFLNRFSKYNFCPRCKARAYYLASDRTIESATYSSTGEGETTHTCKACGTTKRKRYTIAQKTSSSSSSSSGGSSSSSDSGGSWGGGSSGGGGSTSSW